MKTLETFYKECIESKIAQCELKAKTNGRSHCTKSHAAAKLEQATFLEDQKEWLVQKLVEKNPGKDLSKINAFLIESFFASLRTRPGNSAYETSGHNGDGARQDQAHYPFTFDAATVRKMREPVHQNASKAIGQEKLSKLFELPWSDGSLLADENDDQEVHR